MAATCGKTPAAWTLGKTAGRRGRGAAGPATECDAAFIATGIVVFDATGCLAFCATRGATGKVACVATGLATGRVAMGATGKVACVASWGATSRGVTGWAFGATVVAFVATDVASVTAGQVATGRDVFGATGRVASIAT